MNQAEIDKWKAETEAQLRGQRESHLEDLKRKCPPEFHPHLESMLDLLARHAHEGMVMGLQAGFRIAKGMGAYDVAGTIRGRIRNEIACRPEGWKKFDFVFEEE